MQDYWRKQTADKPLFPDLLWSRPETKRTAGKLLIVGGNAHGFAAAGEAYNKALNAGVGTARVLLPDSLQKTVGRIFETGEYAPSTPSGSFGRQALAELLSMAEWADAVLLAGDFGRNSETAVLLEQLVTKYTGPLVATQDALDYFIKSPRPLLEQPNTALAPSFAQLQKLASSAGFTPPFIFSMDFLRLVEALHAFTEKYPVGILTEHSGTTFVAMSGQVSTTKTLNEEKIWRVKRAAHAAVWLLQNADKPFEALTTSLVGEPTAR